MSPGSIDLARNYDPETSRELMPDREPVEAPGLPDAHARRFEVFEPRPMLEYGAAPA